MKEGPVNLEDLLLAILAADDRRRRAALRFLRGEVLSAPIPDDTGESTLMRMGEAARYLGVSRCTLWRLLREGRIERVEMRRGSYRVRKGALDRFARGRQGAERSRTAESR